MATNETNICVIFLPDTISVDIHNCEMTQRQAKNHVIKKAKTIVDLKNLLEDEKVKKVIFDPMHLEFARPKTNERRILIERFKKLGTGNVIMHHNSNDWKASLQQHEIQDIRSKAQHLTSTLRHLIEPHS